MVNQETIVSIRQITLHLTFGTVDDLLQAVQSCLIVSLIVRVYFRQCLADVRGNDTCIRNRIPYMRFYSVYISMCMGMRMYFMNEIDSLRHVIKRQFGCIGLQSFCPCLFKPDMADTQIGFASCQFDELLGSRVVYFRISSFGNNTNHLEFVSSNGFCEIS